MYVMIRLSEGAGQSLKRYRIEGFRHTPYYIAGFHAILLTVGFQAVLDMYGFRRYERYFEQDFRR